ncbi:MAG TPA: Druantia anti-phage system protein DruA, partial [Candidatus Saccharimonadales bacterium]|nr:Druantia anti-phage system protein DruA [Candidatus Saccharimonadales bacterium]
MRIAGRDLSTELLEQLQQKAADCSRRKLAVELCGQADWRTPSGRPALMTARKALAQLTCQGLLPAPLYRPPPKARVPEAPTIAEVVGPLEALAPLEVRLVPRGPSAQSRQWRQLLHHHHYLGAGPLCGAQLRYLVMSPQGPVAALAFSAAARQVAGRERWIGWDLGTRRQNLHRVINNSRFLVLGRVPNLASLVLSRVTARLAQDWEERYGYRPVLVETFVELERLSGGCYRAANWQAIAVTQGRGRQDRRHGQTLARKSLWVYPLARNFRQVLQQPPPTPCLAPLAQGPPPPPSVAPVDWAEEELGRAQLGDSRLVRRACDLARAFWARPQATLPQACGSRADTKAAYRFLENPRVTMTGLLSSHTHATAQRMAREAVVLAVQDTTSLNYSTHPATEMLGLIGSRAEGLIGMHVHSTLAFNREGTPLGLVDVQCWTRDPEDFGKKHDRYQLPFEAKESVR